MRECSLVVTHSPRPNFIKHCSWKQTPQSSPLLNYFWRTYNETYLETCRMVRKRSWHPWWHPPRRRAAAGQRSRNTSSWKCIPRTGGQRASLQSAASGRAMSGALFLEQISNVRSLGVSCDYVSEEDAGDSSAVWGPTFEFSQQLREIEHWMGATLHGIYSLFEITLKGLPK